MTVKHLALNKYLKLREKYGHDIAVKRMTQKECDEVFDLMMRNSVPENYHEATGGFIIREDIRGRGESGSNRMLMEMGEDR